MESGPEELQPAIEEQAYSKATRRSINGYISRVSEVPNTDESSDDDSIIIGDSGDEMLAQVDEEPIKEEPDQWTAVVTSIKEE